jgi:hypothetical protein
MQERAPSLARRALDFPQFEVPQRAGAALLST